MWLYQFGQLYTSLGDLTEATAALACAVEVDTAAYGSDHPEVATDLEALAAVQERQGDAAAAAANRRQAERIRGLPHVGSGRDRHGEPA